MKQTLNLVPLLKTLSCLLFTISLNAQLSHPCGIVNCTANDFELTGAFLSSDLVGTQLTSSACDNAPASAYVCVTVKNKTSSSRNGLFVKTRILEGSDAIIIEECFDQNMPANTEVTLCIDSSYTWSCASELTLTDYLVSWSVGNADICPGGIINCGSTNKAKCVNRSDQNINVEVPIVARIGYSCEPNGDFNDLIFQNNSVGGDPNYNYSWTFTDGEINSSSQENPTNRYSSSIANTNASLTITDANGASDQITINVDIDQCLLLLPVEFVSFEARKKERNIHLSWETAFEINNQGFEIERSFNGVNWDVIDFVTASTSSNNYKEYSFIDKNTPERNIYYRLKQIDYDGKFEYSNIRSIKKSTQDEIYLYPNPSKGLIHLEGAKDGQISIFDNSGRQLVQMVHRETAPVDISNLPAGSYTLKLTSSFETLHLKFIKK